MRRFVIVMLIALLVIQSSAAAVQAQQIMPPRLHPFASMSQQQRSHYVVHTLGAPDFTEARKPHMHANPPLYSAYPTPVFHPGVLVQPHGIQRRLNDVSRSMPDLRAKHSHVASITTRPSITQQRMLPSVAEAHQVKPMTVGPTGGGTTGQNAWWSFAQGGIPGVGTWAANVATGNLVISETDVDIPGRGGLDLSFTRVYNSDSQHDAAGTDGSLPSAYGNGWTSTYDVRIACLHNDGCNTITVFAADGARYDYVSNGTKWTPPAGMQGTWINANGSCGYQWNLKDGTVYQFWSPLITSCAGGAGYGGYAGRLEQVFARNHNNNIHLGYAWDNGDPSSSSHLNTIYATHSDGQQLILKFADFGGYRELATITRPDGAQVTYKYDSSGDLTVVSGFNNNAGSNWHTYSYYAGSYRLDTIGSPQWVYSDGAHGAWDSFTYDGSNRIAGIQLRGWGNFIPNDGTNTPLQGTALQVQQLDYTAFAYPGADETQMTDPYGHATNWFYDSAGRATEEDDWNGATWLKTYASWDTTLDLPTETVDARGNPTDYGWDGNGNLLWVQGPPVQTSQGYGRPLARFTYDGSNNLQSYCDPQYEWTNGASSCPATGGTAHFSWTVDNGGDANEPYGRLTDVYNARGYHRWIQYNTASESGGDYGLPTDIFGDCISQYDGTAPCPHVSITYNNNGLVTAMNTGAGTWSYSYDGLNRPSMVTDPDGVTSCTWYYANGQVSWHESPSERAASGQGGQCNALAAPDSTGQEFTFDADGNLITETHHFNNVATTTTNYYDGADRLVEVQLPQDPNDIFGYWLTRYIYDISNSSTSGEFGNLMSVQRYIPNEATQTGTTVSTGYAWIGVKSWNYDALDRVLRQSYYSPGASTMSTNTWTWDTRGAGLLAAFSNAVGDSVTYTYDPLGDVTRRDFYAGNSSIFAGNLPSEEMTYDPDGRLASFNNDETGMSFMSYDGDGNVASYTEPNGAGSWTRPSSLGAIGPISLVKSYNFSYYGDDALSQLAETDGQYSQEYNYRVDGLLESQQSTASWTSSGTPYSANYAWNETFTPAGRVNYKSDTLTDPYPQGSSTRHTMAYNGTSGLPYALNVAYDAYGRISNWAVPEGTYSSFQYDAEGEPSGFSAGGKSFAFGYSTRGELLSEGQTGATPIAAFRSADGFLYGATAECGTNRYGVQHCYVPTLSFDPRNGALTGTQEWDSLGYFVYVAITYDLAGRRYGSEYDALNRLYRDDSAYSQGPGTIPENGGSITYHSVLGHTPTWASQNGNVTDVKLGMNNDILPTNTSFSGLTVYDRDPWGYAAAARNATGTSKWTLPNMFSGCDASGNLAAATSGFAGTPMTNCAPGGLLYAYRTDGYFNGSLTFRGVRTYSSDTQQWSSPDLYQGMASDPMRPRLQLRRQQPGDVCRSKRILSAVRGYYGRWPGRHNGV